MALGNLKSCKPETTMTTTTFRLHQNPLGNYTTALPRLSSYRFNGLVLGPCGREGVRKDEVRKNGKRKGVGDEREGKERAEIDPQRGWEMRMAFDLPGSYQLTGDHFVVHCPLLSANQVNSAFHPSRENKQVVRASGGAV